MKSIKKMNLRLKKQELMTKQHSAMNSIKHSSTFNLVAHLMKMMMSKLLILFQSRFLWTENTIHQLISRSSRPEVFCKKGVPRNFAKFTGKETLAQMFSCEFCEISKNTSFLQNTSGGCF